MAPHLLFAILATILESVISLKTARGETMSAETREQLEGQWHSVKTIEPLVVKGGLGITCAFVRSSEDSGGISLNAGTQSTNQPSPSASSGGVTKRRHSYKPSASPHWLAAKRLVALYMTLLEGQFTSLSLPNKQRIEMAQRSCLKILDREELTPEGLETIIKYAAQDMEGWPNGPFAVSNFFGFARRWHEFKLKLEHPEKMEREMRVKRADMAEKLRKQDEKKENTTAEASGGREGDGS